MLPLYPQAKNTIWNKQFVSWSRLSFALWCWDCLSEPNQTSETTIKKNAHSTRLKNDIKLHSVSQVQINYTLEMAWVKVGFVVSGVKRFQCATKLWRACVCRVVFDFECVLSLWRLCVPLKLEVNCSPLFPPQDEIDNKMIPPSLTCIWPVRIVSSQKGFRFRKLPKFMGDVT